MMKVSIYAPYFLLSKSFCNYFFGWMNFETWKYQVEFLHFYDFFFFDKYISMTLFTYANLLYAPVRIHLVQNMSPRWYIRNFDERGACMVHL